MSHPARVRVVLVLALAIAGISVAAPLIRLTGAQPVAIAIWRLVISLVIITVALHCRARRHAWLARVADADTAGDSLWALGHLPAYVVNIAVLGEPVGAILLGVLLPGIREIPTAGVLAGGAVVLGGIVLTLPRREAGH